MRGHGVLWRAIMSEKKWDSGGHYRVTDDDGKRSYLREVGFFADSDIEITDHLTMARRPRTSLAIGSTSFSTEDAANENNVGHREFEGSDGPRTRSLRKACYNSAICKDHLPQAF